MLLNQETLQIRNLDAKYFSPKGPQKSLSLTWSVQEYCYRDVEEEEERLPERTLLHSDTLRGPPTKKRIAARLFKMPISLVHPILTVRPLWEPAYTCNTHTGHVIKRGIWNSDFFLSLSSLITPLLWSEGPTHQFWLSDQKGLHLHRLISHIEVSLSANTPRRDVWIIKTIWFSLRRVPVLYFPCAWNVVKAFPVKKVEEMWHHHHT